MAMYTMERVQKFRVFLAVVMVLAFSFAVVGSFLTGEIAMFLILFLIGLLAALLHFVLGLIQKDISEQMWLLKQRMDEQSKE